MAKSRFKNLFKSADPVIIEPYAGFANETRLYSIARVLEDEGIRASENDGTFKNLWNTYKRLESDEISFARVEVFWEDQSKIVMANDEGYLNFHDFHSQHVKGEKTKWLPLKLKLIEPDNGYETSTQLLKPGVDAEFGVITDMDDTVIHTGVSSLLKWRLIANSMLVHAKKRKPLKGVQEWYQLLHLGKGSSK